MKYLTLVFLTFAFFSMSKTAEARNHVVKCDSCTNSQMKNKATSIRPTRYYEYVYVFDEAKGKVKKYRISQRYIDDFIEFTVATEMTVESALYNSWRDYLYHSRMAKSFLLNSLEQSPSYGLRLEPRFLNQYSSGNDTDSYCFNSPFQATAYNVRNLDVVNAFDYGSSSQARVAVTKAIIGNNPYMHGVEVALQNINSIVDSIVGFKPFGDLLVKVPFHDGTSALAAYNSKTGHFEPNVAMDKDCNVIPKTLNEARELNQMNFSSEQTYEAMEDYFNKRFNSQWFSEAFSQGKFNTCSIKVTCRDESNSRYICVGRWQCH